VLTEAAGLHVSKPQETFPKAQLPTCYTVNCYSHRIQNTS